MNRIECIGTAAVARFSCDESQLRIIWADGHSSIFDSLWLRDNCPEDRHPTTGQRSSPNRTESKRARGAPFRERVKSSLRGSCESLKALS